MYRYMIFYYWYFVSIFLYFYILYFFILSWHLLFYTFILIYTHMVFNLYRARMSTLFSSLINRDIYFLRYSELKCEWKITLVGFSDNCNIFWKLYWKYWIPRHFCCSIDFATCHIFANCGSKPCFSTIFMICNKIVV